jgi:N-acetylneuraminic acid mutarotase
MIVWGGRDWYTWFNSGGRYNPISDSWTATSTTNAPTARWLETAIWTVSEMVVWGGTDQTNYLHTGGRYNPSTNSWIPTSITNAPLGRVGHTAVWTGSEMIVWGGAFCYPCMVFNTGGRYNAGTDSWTATSIANAPTGRWDYMGLSGIWVGGEMVIWGGSAATPIVFNTGGRYCAQSVPTPTPTTATPTPTATPRIVPTPRAHPTPHPRP